MLLDLVATHLHRGLKSGRNKPLLFGCSDRRGNHIGDFVLKLSGAMDTRDRGPACELIAVHLADHFGISHSEPAAVTQAATQPTGPIVLLSAAQERH